MNVETEHVEVIIPEKGTHAVNYEVGLWSKTINANTSTLWCHQTWLAMENPQTKWRVS